MAKNREIVPITAPNQNKNSIKFQDAPSLKNFILKARIPQLLHREELFCQINNLLPIQEQIDIYNFLLTKSQTITEDDNFNMQLCFNAANTIFNQNKLAHPEVKEKSYTRVITILNNGLALNCKPKNHTNDPINWNKSIEGVIDDFANQNNLDKALNLAKLSREQRKDIVLGENNQSSTTVADFLTHKQENQTSATAEHRKNQEAIIAYLQACNKIAELANKIVDINVQTEGLQQAVELYNVATICNQLEFRQQALQHMANLHKSLGDNNKAIALEKEAQNITSDNPNTIKTFGITDAETINIKQQIKEETLDPIYQATADGKWTNMQLTFWGWQEQGAQKYIPAKPDNQNDEDYNIKMGLIFESIILAINNSENHDPTCAIIFAQKYPEIIHYVIEHHPEYFVNKDILYICAEKLDIKELQELTNNNEPAASGYKSYQEKAIIPFIEKRLTTDNIIQKAKGLATGAWDDYTKTQLLTLFQDLKIGNNLGAISDSIGTARILLIKAVVDAITESKSLNFAPFQEICNEYPELIKEIHTYHPEYLGNDAFISKIAEQVVTQESKEPVIHHLVDEFSTVDIHMQKADPFANLAGEGVSADPEQV